MSKIVIKKRISLDILGPEYADGYLEFKTIPMRDYQKYSKEASNNKDESRAVDFITSTLDKLFVEGKFPNDKGELEDFTKEELGDLDVGTVVTVFKILTGQDQDPKA